MLAFLAGVFFGLAGLVLAVLVTGAGEGVDMVSFVTGLTISAADSFSVEGVAVGPISGFTTG